MPEASQRFADLLKVQDLDTSIDQLVHRRATLPERAELAAVESEILGLNSKRQEVGSVRDELGSRQSALEEQIGSSKARSAQLQQRMLTVTASRDLQAMDEEVRHLARHVTELEDREIEVMEELEPLDAELSVLDGELSRLGGRQSELRSAISMLEGEIGTELEAERKERQGLGESVPADLLTRYEQLRTRLSGTGAARLIGGSCGGCHLQLPAVELDRVRHADPDAILYCDQCGRILVR
jgi:uncharacterized protein